MTNPTDSTNSSNERLPAENLVEAESESGPDTVIKTMSGPLEFCPRGLDLGSTGVKPAYLLPVEGGKSTQPHQEPRDLESLLEAIPSETRGIAWKQSRWLFSGSSEVKSGDESDTIIEPREDTDEFKNDKPLDFEL